LLRLPHSCCSFGVLSAIRGPGPGSDALLNGKLGGEWTRIFICKNFCKNFAATQIAYSTARPAKLARGPGLKSGRIHDSYIRGQRVRYERPLLGRQLDQCRPFLSPGATAGRPKHLVLIFRLPEGAMSETRKLVAILGSDVIGCSRLAGTDEEGRLPGSGRSAATWSTPFSAHHSRIVKRTGDGSIVEFRSVVDAVRCAIEVQNGMFEGNARLPPERRIEFLHVGDEAEQSDDDLMCDGVNIAARMEGIAKPGGILSFGRQTRRRDRVGAGGQPRPEQLRGQIRVWFSPVRESWRKPSPQASERWVDSSSARWSTRMFR
jgi:class 3 adenylate cyclase